MSTDGQGQGFVRLMVDFDFSRAEWTDALRGTIVATAIVLAFVLTGRSDLVLPASFGAVFVAFAESGQPLGLRWRPMLWTTLWLMVALTLGVTVSDSVPVTILITAPVALVCGAVGYLGPRAALTGMLSLVVFAAYAGAPMSVASAPQEAALIGLGGAVQTLVCVVVGLLGNRGRMPSAAHVAHPRFRELLTDQQGFLRHGIRLAILMTVATTISELWAIPHAYWLPVAIAWVTKPDRRGTVTRVIQRVLGTLLGVLIIGIPSVLVTPTTVYYVLFTILGSAIAIAFIWVNYHIGVAGVTIWILAMVGLDGDPLGEDIGIRIGLTVGAAVLVYLSRFLWRTTALD